MSTVTQRPARGYRTLRLALGEADYERFLSDGEFAKAQLEHRYRQHPELFPPAWEQGYVFYGYTEASRKQQLHCRRIRLRASEELELCSKLVYGVEP